MEGQAKEVYMIFIFWFTRVYILLGVRKEKLKTAKVKTRILGQAGQDE